MLKYSWVGQFLKSHIRWLKTVSDNTSIFIYIYIYICIYINNIQSVSEDSGCGLFMYRIYDKYHINLCECLMYGYCCISFSFQGYITKLTAWWKLYKNATCCFEQIQEVAPHKTASAWPTASHLKNHPSRTYGAL